MCHGGGDEGRLVNVHGPLKRESIKVDGTRVVGTCLSAVGLYIGHCCRLVAK